jgi:hypothetical protein
LLQQFIIPFILMIFFTFLTAKNLYRSRKINSTLSSNSSKSNKTINIDRKFTITSVIINILFLLFNLPYFLLFMINKYTNLFINLNDLFEFLEAFTYLMLYVNLGFTIFINYFVNTMFKQEIEIFLSEKKIKIGCI